MKQKTTANADSIKTRIETFLDVNCKEDERAANADSIKTRIETVVH